MVLGLMISLLAALHMLAVGAASVLPLFIATYRCLGLSRVDAIDTTLRQLAKFATFALVAAAVIGLMAGYLRYVGGDSSYTAMLARFPTRVYLHTGIQWGFSLLCLGGWLATWNWGRRHRYAHGLLALVAATNLLYHFPPLMFLQRMLADRPDLIADSMVTRPLARGLMLQAEVLSRSLHFVAVASALSCGLLIFVAPPNTDRNKNWYHLISAWGGVATSIGVILSGVAVVIFIPGAEAAWLTGRGVTATLAMLATIVTSLAILSSFAMLAVRSPTPDLQARPLQLAVLATFLMTFADRVTL